MEATTEVVGLDDSHPEDEAVTLFVESRKRADALGHQRRAAATVLAAAFVRGSQSGALEKLSRYERSIESGFIRSLHELERIQRARMGETLPPPAVADLNVAVDQAGCGAALDQDGYVSENKS